MDLSFKKCSLEDLQALVEIARVTFADAFESQNKPEDFANYIRGAFSPEIMKAKLLDPNTSFYFTYLGTELVGYFKLNQKDAQTERFEGETVELERIYVLAAFQGRQIGKEMLYKAISLAKAAKVSFLWLGVWEYNKDAIRFYERHHFKKFDTHYYYLGDDKQTDWLLKLRFN